MEIDGVWMVDTPEGLMKPNSAEMMMEGPGEMVNTSDMDPDTREAFLAERLKEALRTSPVSDEEYAERLRRAGLEP